MSQSDSAAIERALSDRKAKPSAVHHGDLYVTRIYTDESTDPHVYDHCKHVWLKANGQVLVILHYFEDGSHRYVHWPVQHVRWWQVTPERFEVEE